MPQFKDSVERCYADEVRHLVIAHLQDGGASVDGFLSQIAQRHGTSWKAQVLHDLLADQVWVNSVQVEVVSETGPTMPCGRPVVLFTAPSGQLARAAGYRLPLMVLHSDKGFYLGTANDEGPVSRESVESWPTRAAAETALAGEQGKDWSQLSEP